MVLEVEADSNRKSMKFGRIRINRYFSFGGREFNLFDIILNFIFYVERLRACVVGGFPKDYSDADG